MPRRLHMYEGWTKPELWLHQLWQLWLGVSCPLQTHDSGLLGESLSVGLLTSRFYVCFICWNSIRKLIPFPSCLDSSCRWEDLHDLLCGDHIPGLFLPHQPDFGCGCYGIRWAERSHLGWSSWERRGVSKITWATQEPRARGQVTTIWFHFKIRLNCLKTSATSDSQCNHIDNVMHIKTPNHLQWIDLHWYVTLICWYIVVYLNYRQAVKHLWPARRHKVEGQTGQVPCTVLAVMML